VNQGVASTPHATEQRHTLPIKRMPAILNYNGLRSICGMSFDPVHS